MPTSNSPDDKSTSIAEIVERLRKRSKRSYVDVRERMASHMKIEDYSINNFNRKFRRGDDPVPARYETDEMMGLVKAFVQGLSDDQRCLADEALQLFSLARISLHDFDKLKALFPSVEYANAWAQYAPQLVVTPFEVPPESDPNFLKPYYPQIFIGRSQDVEKIKIRLGLETKEPRQAITVIRGWPGVGKTTLVNRLAHDQALIQSFTGILWASLGHNANLFGTLKSWLNQLDTFYSGQDKTLEELVTRLRAALQNKNMLLIVDDIWKIEDGVIFKRVATEKNTLLMTTRFTHIAEDLAEASKNVYFLDVLSDKDALALLREIAPRAVEKYERRLGSLIKTLEGLPLALRVAGSLLEREQSLGLDVEKLIKELEETYLLFKQTAPTTYFDEATGQTPSISLLFQRSVETLQPIDQVAFADLGVFASKPATFDLKAIAYVCELDDPIPTIRELVGHGLLEPMGNARFQMHYTLSMYAKSFNENDDDSEENSA